MAHMGFRLNGVPDVLGGFLLRAADFFDGRAGYALDANEIAALPAHVHRQR